jgi:hypothetical protein
MKVSLKPCKFLEPYRLTYLLRFPQSFRSISLIFFIILFITPGFLLPGFRLISFSHFTILDFRYENLYIRSHFFLVYIPNAFRFLEGFLHSL